MTELCIRLNVRPFDYQIFSPLREEKMREDKIAELECMQSGKGNRLKDNSSASVSDTKKTNSSCAKTAAKRRMKPG
ncbi:hypothetical protein E2C01_088054 [Portunus trituberculatus]|uniref:Uncharacterized protein n=1 Tax=Portunus trituberculatus TaxID=210409 RepID=A0A5B7J540_PORTR|nr:hypothetical protein [Portunus trituberculatus]